MNSILLKKFILKCEKFESLLKRRDNQFAFFRLVLSLVLLAVIVPLCHDKPYDIVFLLIIFFLVVCFILSILHKKIQEKFNFWKSISKSATLSLARKNRDFLFLKEQESPWHSVLAVNPPHHLYASDIDVGDNLFLFLDSCSTEGGSEKLFHLLLTAGLNPCDKNERQKRIEISTKLSQKSALLRRFESLRLSDEFVKNYYKRIENKKLEKESPEKENGKNSYWKEFAYAVMSLFVWFGLFLPLFVRFFKTKNFEAFLQPLFLYAFFILVGIAIFEPLVIKATEMARCTKYIELLLKSLGKSKNNALSDLGHYSFLKPNSLLKIKGLNFLIDILSLRGNPVFWVLIHLFFPFDAVFSLFLLLQFKKLKEDIVVWQNEIHEFDLCVSFARLKAENKEFCFFLPEEKNSMQSISFTSLGHPLLSFESRIGNHLTLEKNSPLVLLTGSNMSGKSTFLRSFATNMLLFNMGAPVCAKQFQVPSMRILCAIKVEDSLAHGTSYFYAEVKRLVEILKELKFSPVPCLFFIDEIFKGTNNKERYLGSLSLLKEFLNLNGFGFVSTHDLALTALGNSEPRLRNMHFRESIVEDKLTFDYLLKEGPCPTTNALFIMKLAGLPVETSMS